VPGIASKNVIDVQVTVADLQVPVQQQLEEAGFVFRTAEDYELLRNGMVLYLSSKGFNIPILAGNEAELLDLLRQAVELPAVCLVDLYMPVMDGSETIRKGRKSYPNMRILAMAVFNEYDQEELIKKDADGLVLKSDSLDKLIHTITSVCG